MLRWLLGMTLAFSFSCFAKPSTKTEKRRCGANQYYSYSDDGCLSITSNIHMLSRCPTGMRPVGTGYVRNERALACAADPDEEANQDFRHRSDDDYQQVTEGTDKTADEQTN